MVHIAGFVTGFMYYRWFESPSLSVFQRTSRKKYQWMMIAVVGTLALSWAAETYWAIQHPYRFVDKLMAADDPVLTAVAAPAVPDDPNATEADVRRARAQALDHLEEMDYNAFAIARADFWLGDTESALKSIRTESETRADNDLVISLWLAIEKSQLPDNRTLLPDNYLPAGTGGVYLVSEDGLNIARVNYGKTPINLSVAIKRPRFKKWGVLREADSLPEDAIGVWPLKANQYRTQNSVSASKTEPR